MAAAADAAATAEFSTGQMLNDRDRPVYTCRWLPAGGVEPKGVVVLFHGCGQERARLLLLLISPVTALPCSCSSPLPPRIARTLSCVCAREGSIHPGIPLDVHSTFSLLVSLI